MKRIITVLLLLAMVFSATMVYAEDYKVNKIDNTRKAGEASSDIEAVIRSSLPERIAGILYSTIHKTAVRTKSVNVHKMFWNSSHSRYTETFVYPNAARITYRYDLYVSNGQYTGGRVIISNNYPSVTALNANTEYNVSVSKVSNPTYMNVTGSGNSWSVTVSGGQYNITYNSEIQYDYQGNVISTSSSTLNYGFYLSETGP